MANTHDNQQNNTSLQRESLGARGLEHYARNPSCLRLAALTMLGVSPAQAVQTLFGEIALEGQSPFAMNVGNRFENHIFKNNAAELRTLYMKTGRLSNNNIEVIDIASTHPRTTLQDLQLRRDLTLEHIQNALTNTRGRPLLLIHPRLHLEFLDHRIDIEPDALLIMHDTTTIYPIEIKSYVDRGGYTPTASIRGACRQAAVGIVALRRKLELDIPAHVDLILRQPTRFEPTLRSMTLQSEVESLERTIDQAHEQLGNILSTLEQQTLEIRDRTHFESLPNHFCDGCKEHCALASICKREAFNRGSPAALGKHAQDTLSALNSIPQAWALLRGERQPLNDQEVALLNDLREQEESFHRVHPRFPEDQGDTHGC